MKTVTIELPDEIVVKGMKGAPEALKTIKTDLFGPAFILDAIVQGLGTRLGDTWSVTKKDEEKTDKVRTALEKGLWATRERTGESLVKFDKAIQTLNAVSLKAKLSKEQLMELAALIAADKE